jgi:hypothetical protein
MTPTAAFVAGGFRSTMGGESGTRRTWMFGTVARRSCHGMCNPGRPRPAWPKAKVKSKA